MKRKHYLVLLATMAAGGCATAQNVYQVEVCLAGREQVDGFVTFMRSVADDSGLVFADGSTGIEEDARMVDQAADLMAHAGKVIYFGAESGTGAGGFTAGNLGLNPLQIGVGMTPSRDASFNVSRINETIDEIGRRWTAHRIPASATFKPRPGCGEENFRN